MRRFCPFVLLLLLLLRPAAAAPLTVFPASAHPHALVEWWYVNAHVTTRTGRHLAIVGSFFRFGNGLSPFDGKTPTPRAHYLIYAVTDLDKHAQRAYSLADTHMAASLKQLAPLLASNPKDPHARALLSALKRGTLPAPHKLLHGDATVSATGSLRLAYGTENTLQSANETNTAYTLTLGGGTDKLHLTLVSTKPPMAVGGSGETGLVRPDDMFYYSLTRCAVTGTIDTGAGLEAVTTGTGWLDHQWGSSWGASNNGWDWWGIQLNDGTDILAFRQRNLSTGTVFFPLATFMDKDGRQSVTRNIQFTPYNTWKSPTTGARYPLRWRLTFPDKRLALDISAAVASQEMPVLASGGAIWEGTCRVSAPGMTGTAYMELVGYNSPAVRKQMQKRP